MKRLGWLLLLVSVGLNLGLGYRLLNRSAAPDDFSRFDRSRDHGRMEGEPRQRMNASPDDSVQWRQVMDRRLERMARRLDLDPQQVETFRLAHQRTEPLIRQQRSLVEQGRERLQKIIASGAVDSDQVRDAIHEVGRHQVVLDSLVTETLLQEMSTLTPEQRAGYLRILPVFRGPGGGRGPGRGGPNHPR